MSNHVTAGAEGYPSAKPRVGTTQSDIAQLQRDNPSVFLEAANAVQHDTQRRIVHALVHGLGDATYNEIRELATVSDRTIRKHVGRLEEKGLVRREQSFITLVTVTSRDVLVLLEHALECYYDTSL